MATSVGPSVGEDRLDQVAPVVTTTDVDPTAEAAIVAAARQVVEEVTPEVSAEDSVVVVRVDSPLAVAMVTELVRGRARTNPICPTTSSRPSWIPRYAAIC